MARPTTKKWNPKRIINLMKRYTNDTQLPILKEFCFNNNLEYKYLLQLCANNKELDRARCRLLDKKEIQLEKALMTGANNTAFIFQLKQLGWRDNPEPIVINNTVNNTAETRAEKIGKLSTEQLEELEDIYSSLDSTDEATKQND